MEKVVETVISLNLKRRHLTSAQRAVVAAKAKDVIDAEKKRADERHREGSSKGGKATQKIESPSDGRHQRKPQAVSQNIEEQKEDRNEKTTDHRIAEKYGTNRQYVADACKIAEYDESRGTDLLDQRAAVAAKAKDVIDAEKKKAEDRRRNAGETHGRGQEKVVQKIGQPIEPDRADHRIAGMLTACVDILRSVEDHPPVKSIRFHEAEHVKSASKTPASVDPVRESSRGRFETTARQSFDAGVFYCAEDISMLPGSHSHRFAIVRLHLGQYRSWRPDGLKALPPGYLARSLTLEQARQCANWFKEEFNEHAQAVVVRYGSGFDAHHHAVWRVELKPSDRVSDSALRLPPQSVTMAVVDDLEEAGRLVVAFNERVREIAYCPRVWHAVAVIAIKDLSDCESSMVQESEVC